MENTIPTSTHFLQLPFDVLVRIFSFVSQSTCLECSLVCRSLYNSLPCWSQSVWEKLYLENPCPAGLTRFLGPHVKSLEFDGSLRHEKIVYESLSTVDLSGLRALAFHDRNSKSSQAKSRFLQKVQATKLKELTLKGSYDVRNVALLLEKNAQHLRSICFSSQENICFWSSTKTEMPHLIKLELNMRFEKRHFEVILNSCPNLQFLDFIQTKADVTKVQKDLDVVFAKCPKLFYLGYRCDWPGRAMPIEMNRKEADGPLQQQGTNPSPQLGHLHLEGDTSHLETTFLPLVRSCAARLESIVIDGCGLEDTDYRYYDWTWLINGIHLPRLRHLYIRTIRFGTDAFVQFVGRHAATLQAVGIHSVSFDSENSPGTATVADAIRAVHRLEHLYYDGVVFTGPERTEMIRSHSGSLRMLQLRYGIGDIDPDILQELPWLESLEIDFRRDTSPDGRDPGDLLKKLAAASLCLHSLTISNLRFSSDDICFGAIAEIKSLRSLTLLQCSGWSEPDLLRFTHHIQNRIESFRIANSPLMLTSQTKKLLVTILGSHRIKLLETI